MPAYILGRLKKTKIVILVPDLIYYYTNGINRVFRSTLLFLERFVLKRSWDKIICISGDVQKKLVQLGVDSEKISIVFCGVSFEEIKKIQKKKNSTFPTIVCVSRLVSYKRIKDLIKAMQILKKKYSNIKLIIVGIGEEKEKLEKLVKKYHLESDVLFHGFVKSHKNVLSLVKNSDIFCSTSIVEGFGIAIVEALALGVPCVLSDISVFREVTRGKGVLFFKPQDSEDLAKKIRMLLKDKNLYKKLRKEGIKQAKIFSWKSKILETEKIYENLCTH